MKKHLTILMIALVATSTAFSQNRSIEFNHGTFNEVLEKAKKENKMIFVDCYTKWCGPCKWMAKNIFTNDTVADFYNTNFINAKIDLETEEGKVIAKKYKIANFPTFIYLNGDGIQLHRICGSMPVKNFISVGENALVPEKQLATSTTNFNQGKTTPEFASAYFSMVENACLPMSSELDNYYVNIPEANFVSKNNWKIIYTYVDDNNSKLFNAFEKERSAFSKLSSNDSVESKLNQVYERAMYMAVRTKNVKEFETLKTKLRNSKTKDAEKIILRSDIMYYESTGDWTSYASKVLKYLKLCPSQNPNELNNYAWTFYEHVDDTKMLETAEGWALKSTELDNNFYNQDTYAAVLYKLGKKEKATTAAQKAIEFAKKAGEDFKATELLLEKINALK